MHPAAAGGRTSESPGSGRAAAAGGPRGMPRKTWASSGSAGSCSRLRSPGAPGAQADTQRVFSFRGDRHRWALGAAVLCPLPPHRGVGLLTLPRNHGPHPALDSGGEKRQQERNKNRKRKFTGAERATSSQGGDSR